MKGKEDLTKLSLPALREKEGELRKSIFTLRMDLAINKLKNHRSIRNTRRELARVLTTINQKNRSGQKAG
jgi:large subunit ribosomal protein L29